MPFALLFSVFVIASCGLAYELIAAALSSYLLGDSITQFSTVIGCYLFAMGVGSWLSKYVERDVAATFVRVQLLVGVIGGCSGALLFGLFAWLSGSFLLVLYLLVFVVGTLVGLEIPLVMRLLQQSIGFKDLVSKVLTFDYLGALAVSILFPLLLAPYLGMVRTALMFGVFNVAVALWALHLFRAELALRRGLWLAGIASLALLLAAFAGAERFSRLAEQALYQDNVVLSTSTPYQRIVVTRWKDDTRLFLNGNLQFSSHDEYRYHEALVHPGLSAMPWARKVLVLGGGDGMAVREVLKYPHIESVTLVELDPEMPRLFREHPALRRLNGDALHAPRVTVVDGDAFRWLEEHDTVFDFIVVDFPDPSNFAVGKLYSNTFYRLLERHLNARGRAVIQSTSPLYARQSFWTVVHTVESVGLTVTPYHATVPSFGEWGYILAGREAYAVPVQVAVPTRFVTPSGIRAMLDFPPDMQSVPTGINRLDNQILVRTFEQEWRRVIR